MHLLIRRTPTCSRQPERTPSHLLTDTRTTGVTTRSERACTPNGGSDSTLGGPTWTSRSIRTPACRRPGCPCKPLRLLVTVSNPEVCRYYWTTRREPTPDLP